MTDHFDPKEWRAFKLGLLPEKKTVLMEEHLTQCDVCREIFISSISSEEIEEAEKMLSPGFTETVMGHLPQKTKKDGFPKNSFLFYAAAAAVTLVIMGSGFFQLLVENVPTAADLSPKWTDQGELNSWDLSNKMVDKASGWIENFETQDRSGGMKDE